MIYFNSDYTAGAHPEVLDALTMGRKTKCTSSIEDKRGIAV